MATQMQEHAGVLNDCLHFNSHLPVSKTTACTRMFACSAGPIAGAPALRSGAALLAHRQLQQQQAERHHRVHVLVHLRGTHVRQQRCHARQQVQLLAGVGRHVGVGDQQQDEPQGVHAHERGVAAHSLEAALGDAAGRHVLHAHHALVQQPNQHLLRVGWHRLHVRQQVREEGENVVVQQLSH